MKETLPLPRLRSIVGRGGFVGRRNPNAAILCHCLSDSELRKKKKKCNCVAFWFSMLLLRFRYPKTKKGFTRASVLGWNERDWSVKVWNGVLCLPPNVVQLRDARWVKRHNAWIKRYRRGLTKLPSSVSVFFPY